MLTPEDLLKLASAYAEATGLSLSTVAKRALSPNNGKIFNQISKGHGTSSRSIIKATNWFEQNWPENAEWPAAVPGVPINTVPAIVAQRRRRKLVEKTQPTLANLPRHPLWQYRKRYNLTLKDLATRAGMTIGGLSRIECGHTKKPSVATLQSLARATNHEVGEEDIFCWHYRAVTGKDAQEGKPVRSIEPQPQQQQDSPMILTQIPDYPNKVRLQINQIIDLDLAIQILQMLRRAAATPEIVVD